MQMARVQLSTARVQPCKIYSCFPPRKAAKSGRGAVYATSRFSPELRCQGEKQREREERRGERKALERRGKGFCTSFFPSCFFFFFRLTSNELEVSHVHSRPLDVRSRAARCTKMQEAEKERGYSKSN